MNLRPLWTARLRPIKSGVMVERRDHVLMIFFELGPSVSTFLFRCPSTKGPFLIERAMMYQPLNVLFGTLLHNEAIRRLVCPGLVSLGGDTPGGYRMTATRCAPLATT